MKRIWVLGTLAAWLLSVQVSPALAGDKLRIVATTPSIASLAGEIAGKDAEVYSIAPANRNLHFITPTPKDVLKVKKADVFIHGGLDLEVWRGPLLDASGRKEFITGERAVDVSQGIALLDKPADASRVHGDIHIHGNPHYWTDPFNAKIMADTIADRLGEFYPESAGSYRTRAEALKTRLDQRLADWQQRLLSYRGRKVTTYHDGWPYFLRRFGLESAGFLEPKPGIPPTPRHLDELTRLMKAEGVRVIIRETYQEKKTPEKLARETGAVIAVLQQDRSVGEGGYEASVESNVAALEEAFRAAEGVN